MSDVDNLANTRIALRDLHQGSLWDSLSAYQKDVATLEPDAGSDAPSIAVFDALLGSVSIPLQPLENGRASP